MKKTNQQSEKIHFFNGLAHSARKGVLFMAMLLLAGAGYGQASCPCDNPIQQSFNFTVTTSSGKTFNCSVSFTSCDGLILASTLSWQTWPFQQLSYSEYVEYGEKIAEKVKKLGNTRGIVSEAYCLGTETSKVIVKTPNESDPNVNTVGVRCYLVHCSNGKTCCQFTEEDLFTSGNAGGKFTIIYSETDCPPPPGISHCKSYCRED